MKTDIEYLRTLDRDLQQAATREKWMQAAPARAAVGRGPVGERSPRA